jgi:hypothetical protein
LLWRLITREEKGRYGGQAMGKMEGYRKLGMRGIERSKTDPKHRKEKDGGIGNKE